MTAAFDDEENWAEARALLRRAPAEAPHRSAARERYDRRALRFAVVLFCTSVVLALVALAVDPPPERGDPPVWRVVTGIAVGFLGVVLLAARLARPYGSRRWLADPLATLTRRQRADLLAHLRGRAPVPPDRLLLVRLQAEHLLEQRTALLVQVGLSIAYLGMWIIDRSWFTTLMALGFGVLSGVAGFVALRDSAHARRFLAAHPAPDGT